MFIIFKNEQQNSVTPSNEQNNNNNDNNPNNNNNTPAARPRQSAWETFKSFIFRMLIFYFITQFFRRSPTNTPATNATLPLNPNTGFIPGNLFPKGELLVRIFFLASFILIY